jgi:hypothetical protein
VRHLFNQTGLLLCRFFPSLFTDAKVGCRPRIVISTGAHRWVPHSSPVFGLEWDTQHSECAVSFCPSDLTGPNKSHPPLLVIPSALRISYHAALINVHVCGFLNESRMKFTDATKPDRKSGGRRGTCSATWLPHKGLRSVSSPTKSSSCLSRLAVEPERRACPERSRSGPAVSLSEKTQGRRDRPPAPGPSTTN